MEHLQKKEKILAIHKMNYLITRRDRIIKKLIYKQICLSFKIKNELDLKKSK